MANETTTSSLAVVVPVEAIQAQILAAAYPFNVVAPLVMNDTQPNGEGLTWNQPIMPVVAAAAVGETSDISAVTRTPTEETITIAEVGARTDLTDLGQEAARMPNQIAKWAEGAGQGIAQKITSDLCDLFATLNSGNEVGGTGVAITIANFLEAKFTLMNANAIGMPRCVLHPRQITDLSLAISASTGTPFSSHEKLVVQGLLPEGTGAGYLGFLFGVPIWHTTECPTANSGADRVGAMFVEQAMAIVTLRQLRTELERNASGRITEIVSTVAYGVGEIRDTFGVPIVTDAG